MTLYKKAMDALGTVGEGLAASFVFLLLGLPALILISGLIFLTILVSNAL